MEGTIVSSSRPFRIKWERSGRTPEPWLILDSVKDVTDGHSEWDEVELCFVSLTGFGRVPGWLVDRGGVVAQILPRGELWLCLLDLGPLSWGATGCGPNCLFYLNVLQRPDKYIPHLSDVILLQMFVEGVYDL